MPDLAVAFEKVKRASIHIGTLSTLISTHVNTNPNPVAYRRRDGTEDVDVIVRIVAAYPAAQWSAAMGDVVHNLRSALDHLVFALSIKHSGEPPTPAPENSWWRSAGFPVVRQELWPEGDAPAGLLGVAPALLPRFRDLQPAGDQFERHPLWVLDELCAQDRQRAAIFGAGNVTFRGIGQVAVRVPAGETAPFTAIVVSSEPPGRVADGGQLAVLRLAPSSPEADIGLAQIKVDSNITYDVTFAQGPPAYGAMVIDTLDECRNRVRAILTAFESEF